MSVSMTPNALRSSFLSYFERHGHRIVPSAPLVPQDDPTLLFTNAGMNQFKDLFLGRETRDYRRATTAQKCMRVSGKHNDLENVGPSVRHHTFFEMLGNFSFGDYFKAEAIELAWTLLTREWGLDPARLRVTVFRGDAAAPRDEEAYRLWRQFVPERQIGELGAADNFWAMGDTGPCGRCSEIYYDRGPAVGGTGDFMTDVEAGSERFVEIWNNVFMEFDRTTDGRLTPLPAPSIDTGMGLERMSAVMQGSTSNYDTALFTPVLDALGSLAGTRHGGTMAPPDVSMRVVADHLRAMSFLIADGVVPSNEWRGYVLRKIMRRAMRHGRRLGLTEPFLHRLVDVLVREMGTAYPELVAGRDTVVQMVRSEEERFDAVLAGGLPRLEDVLDQAAAGSRVVPGDQAFRLYDTYGLPRDFIEDLTAAQGLTFDTAGFEAAMAAQREKARAKSAFDGARKAGELALSATRTDALRAAGDVFEGYGATMLEDVEVLALVNDERIEVDALSAGASGFVALARTPFYLEAGGQVSDAGLLETPDGTRVRVDGVLRSGPGMPRLHTVHVESGALRPGLRVTARVDQARRDATRRNHTGTHLLHAALRQVLGPHVKQAGSLVSPDRLRFDFVHVAPVTPEERLRVEDAVTREILANQPVATAVRNTQDAIAGGATALFGEKYGETVRVVSIGDGRFSTELCGGTHVAATGDIGAFVITEESGVAAGVRRIEALTGFGALEHVRARGQQLEAVVSSLGVPASQADEAVRKLQAEVKRLQRDLQQARTKAALGGGSGTPDDQVTVHGATLIARHVTDVDKDALRTLADTLKGRLTSGIIVLVAEVGDGKVSVVASVTPDLARKAPAGQLVKQLAPLVGGGGGGRPDFAEAGGRDAAGIPALLTEARALVERLLGA